MTESSSTQEDHGHQARTPWQMPLSGWKDIAVRTWQESTKDNIGLVAAGVAFYAFLAIVPMLGATVLTYGLVAAPRTVLANIASIAHLLPASMAQLIGDQLLNVVHTSSGKKGLGVFVALGIALFGARNAAGSVIIALNIAYEEEEKRGFIKVTLLALAITAAAVVLALLGVAAIGALQFIGKLLPNAPALQFIGKLLTPILLAVGASGAAAALYRYGPSREKAEWSWLTPGSLLSAAAWLAVTAGFGIYVTRFAHYDATYGSLGAVVALLTWIYLSAYVFLFGAELNSEIEHQTAHDTTRGADAPLGQRGAWSADHVARGSGLDKAADRPATLDIADVKPARPLAETVANDTHYQSAAQLVGEHPYVASRVTTRLGGLAGLAKIGMISSAMATVGLSLLRKRGRAGAGATLLIAAAGLALLRREDAGD